MARRMHSRSLLFFEKEFELDAYLIVENFRSYSSIILNTTGNKDGNEDNMDPPWYVEIPIIPGNDIMLSNRGDWYFEAYSDDDKLIIYIGAGDNISKIYGLAIWGVK